MFETIPHASFPFDETPWIKHFRDADDANQRAQIHGASSANAAGHGAFADYIMGAKPGDNPFATYKGPFFDGRQQHLTTMPHMPNQLYGDYFGDYRRDGDWKGQGPFADPRTFTPDGSTGPGAGPLVTGDAYRSRQFLTGAARRGMVPSPYPIGGIPRGTP